MRHHKCAAVVALANSVFFAEILHCSFGASDVMSASFGLREPRVFRAGTGTVPRFDGIGLRSLGF